MYFTCEPTEMEPSNICITQLTPIFLNSFIFSFSGFCLGDPLRYVRLQRVAMRCLLKLYCLTAAVLTVALTSYHLGLPHMTVLRTILRLRPSHYTGQLHAILRPPQSLHKPDTYKPSNKTLLIMYVWYNAASWQRDQWHIAACILMLRWWAMPMPITSNRSHIRSVRGS